MPTSEIRHRVATARASIAEAARRVGRDPTEVQVLAVTKTQPPEVVGEALAAGLEEIGENYVQEARGKRAAMEGRGRWHLIGGLQRNKIGAALAVFDCIDTLDSPALAAALSAAAQAAGRRLPVLIQVNIGGEPTKRGVVPDAVEDLAREVLTRPGLLLEGLMTIPPPAGEPEAARPYFRHLRQLRDCAARRLGVELPHLSMGMSDDFAVAVEEGATWVRLGRALFEVRGPGAWRPDSSAGGQGS